MFKFDDTCDPCRRANMPAAGASPHAANVPYAQPVPPGLVLVIGGRVSEGERERERGGF